MQPVHGGSMLKGSASSKSKTPPFDFTFTILNLKES